MFIETIRNRTSPPAVLLRESFRDEQGRAQKRTLANLSKLPRDAVDALKAVLKGATVIGTGPEELEIERSLPHGHVAAVLGTIRKLALPRLILSTAKDEASRRHCDIVVAMMVDRLIAPRSKLSFVRAVDEETALSSLGAVMGLGKVKEREAYDALDWLIERQERIESSLARRHLKGGVLVLYDVSSSYLEGRCCPLAQYGHSRDHRKDRPQIVYGLLCTGEGLPVAVEVFEGNTADPATLSEQVKKVKERFGITHVALVGDRGMITSARIRDDLIPAGLDWISCLRAPDIQALATEKGPLQMSLFDERDLAEISAPDLFKGERLIVCRNRELAGERARKREALLAATERDLAGIKAQVQRRTAKPMSAAAIGLKVGAVLGKKKMAKHFDIAISDGRFSFKRKSQEIEKEARLDGIYVIRTSLPSDKLGPENAVQAYKDLSRVERAFRCLKTDGLEVRPIRHWTPERVRAHVFVCMLAYHVEWHLRQALAPLLFHDTGIAAQRAERTSPVQRTEPSEAAKTKKATKRSADGQRVMGLAGLIAHLGTLTRNTMRVPSRPSHRFVLYAKTTPLQEAAFKLLGLDPVRVQ